jgi:hypothetical protein
MPPAQARKIGREIAEELFRAGLRGTVAYTEIPIRVQIILSQTKLSPYNPRSLSPFIQPYLLQNKITHIARYHFVGLEG